MDICFASVYVAHGTGFVALVCAVLAISLLPPVCMPVQVMTVVKHLVSDGVTVCATIHSPTSYCFNLFDKLMMLVRGRVVYFGSNADGAPVAFARSVCANVKEYTEVRQGQVHVHNVCVCHVHGGACGMVRHASCYACQRGPAVNACEGLQGITWTQACSM